MLCSKIGAAVRELEPEYSGKVRFRVIPIKGDAEREEVKSFDIGTHGLVGLTPEGEVRVKIPGHEFGKPEIQEKTDELLSGAAPGITEGGPGS